MRLARFGAVCALGSLVSLRWPAHAQQAQAAPKRVQIVLVGQLADDEPLPDLLRGCLAPSNIDAEITPGRPPSREALMSTATRQVTLWIRLEGHTVHLYFADPSKRRYLVRSLDLVSGLDELGRERLAQVVVTSSQAFLSHIVASSIAEVDAALAALPNAASQPAPPLLPAAEPQRVAPTVPEAPMFGLGAAGFYQALVFGQPTLRHSVGGGVQLEVMPWHAGVELRGAYDLGRARESDYVRIVEHGASAALRGYGCFLRRFPVAACATLDVGLRYTHVRTHSRAANVTARAAFGETHPALSASFGPRWFSGHGWIGLSAGVTWDARPSRYQVSVEGELLPLTQLEPFHALLALEMGAAPIHF